ncbi:hypothetical protein, partial [Streptomyces sp. NPDC048565]|uniref:hypothetical protein n=1 Tax=Streptomyces sp. NPDC048565 TaxID=3155266 RepID=UPI003433D685
VPAPHLLAEIRRLGDRDVNPASGGRPVTGIPDGGSRIYDVNGAESLAALLLREGPVSAAESALRAMGRTLARLHALQPGPGFPTDPARGAERLLRQLTVGGADAGADAGAPGQRTDVLLRDRLGPRRWSALRRWCALTVEDRRYPVLSHGAPGLGSAVPVQDGDGTVGAELLTGEDLCLAPWYLDLGWVAGELIELCWQCGGDFRAWQALLDALEEGYGREPGTPWSRAAAVRIALHLHDYSAYVAALPDDEVRRYADFLAYLIDL